MNIQSLTYRQRNIYLLAGCILFVFVVYFLAIKKTLTLRSENIALRNSVITGEQASLKLKHVKQKLVYLDNYFKAYALDSVKSQQLIMSEVSNLCKSYDLVLRNFPKAVVSVENDLTMETNVIEAEGNFTDLVKLIYALETTHRIGRIASANFRTYSDNRIRKTILTVTIYLQNVRSDGDAETI